MRDERDDLNRLCGLARQDAANSGDLLTAEEEKLLDAAKRGDLDAVQAALAAGASVEANHAVRRVHHPRTRPSPPPTTHHPPPSPTPPPTASTNRHLTTANPLAPSSQLPPFHHRPAAHAAPSTPRPLPWLPPRRAAARSPHLSISAPRSTAHVSTVTRPSPSCLSWRKVRTSRPWTM